MKKSISILFVLFSLFCSAQVQVDKPIQLTGPGPDAKVTGIQQVNTNSDAANKIYVDTAIANRSSGSSAPAGTVVLINADEANVTNVVNVSYSPCGTGASSGTLKTYALAANTYATIIVEAGGYIELGANGGGTFNTGTVTVSLPSGTSESFTARRQISVGGDTGDNGWRFPFTVSTSGQNTSAGIINVSGNLSLQGCTGGKIVITSLRIYGVL